MAEKIKGLSISAGTLILGALILGTGLYVDGGISSSDEFIGYPDILSSSMISDKYTKPKGYRLTQLAPFAVATIITLTRGSNYHYTYLLT